MISANFSELKKESYCHNPTQQKLNLTLLRLDTIIKPNPPTKTILLVERILERQIEASHWSKAFPTYNLAEPPYNSADPQYNLAKPPYNRAELPYNRAEPPYNPAEPIQDR